MDEFQVLFSEEDRLAREAGRLLADIAKRGAAFGLHLLLATQSPGGLAHRVPAARLRADGAADRPGLHAAERVPGHPGRGQRRGDQADPGRGRDLQRPPRRGRQPGDADRDAADQGAAGADRDDPGAGGRPARTRRRRASTPTRPADFARPPFVRGLRRAAARWPVAGRHRGGVARRGDRDQARHHRDVRALRAVQPAGRRRRGARPRAAAGDLAQRGGPALARPTSRFTVAEFARPSSPFHGFFDPLRDLPHEVRIAGPPDGRRRRWTSCSPTWTRGSPTPTGQPAARAVLPRRRAAPLARTAAPRATAASPARPRPALIRLADKGPDVGMHVVAWADSYATAERALRRAGIGHFGLRAVLRVLSPAESDALLGVSAGGQPGRRPRPVPGHRVARTSRWRSSSRTRSPRCTPSPGPPSGARHDHAGKRPPWPTSPSPYLSLRQAVRPAIFAHFLLAEDHERAGRWPRSARTCSS